MKRALIFMTFFLCAASALMAQNQDSEVTPSPPIQKPYGCFRDLKWDMTIEEVKKSLDFPIKSDALSLITRYEPSWVGSTKISDSSFEVRLFFNNDKLSRIVINPDWRAIAAGKFSITDGERANAYLSSYDLLRPALEKKYGKPAKDRKEDRGDDAVFINNLMDHKAIISTLWQTDESVIHLLVECIPRVDGKYIIYEWSDLLTYSKSAGTKEKPSSSEADL